MEPGKPSQTAMAAAAYRMAHNLVDYPVVFRDPYALKILSPLPPRDPDAEALKRGIASTAGLRAHIVARSLFAEETLATAVARGVTQYVLLGAGLDTFAYRNPFPQIRVFEIDAAPTAAWKQQQLAKNDIPIPPNVTYADIDFEHETLHDGLAHAGVDLTKPAVFCWLGVTMYLTRDAIVRTLSAVKALPHGTQIVFDFSVPRDSQEFNAVQERLRSIGEPFVSFFRPSEMRDLLLEIGFTDIERVNGDDMNRRWFANRTDGLAASPGANVVRAGA